MLAMMRAGGSRGLFNIDEFRHGIERMAPAHYLRATYYEKWLDGDRRASWSRRAWWAAEELAARRRLLRPAARRARDGRAAGTAACRARRPIRAGCRTPSARPEPRAALRAGRSGASRARCHPHGHTRLPRYARGRRGRDPSLPRHPRLPRHQRPRPGRAAAAALQRALRRAGAVGRVGGAEPGRAHRSLGELSPAREVSPMGKNHPNVDPYVVSRVRALESLLLEKGILAPDAVDRVIQRYEADTGPMIGARAVARAWTDPDYRRLLLDDPKAALARLRPRLRDAVVVENTPAVHNLVVCTLCSCYPWPVLGLPPTWYKMPAYRSRAVSEPRTVLRRDGARRCRRRARSASGTRAPRCATWCCRSRPAGTEGIGEAELVPLITRDALIGVAEPCAPASCAPTAPCTSAGATSWSGPTGGASTWRASAGQLFVCATGCCCGRTEDGFAPVPTETFHREWERRRLRNVVHLTIGGCLGPCALANVALLLFDGQAQWFHSIELATRSPSRSTITSRRCSTPTRACRRRPRSRRISSPRPPGSRVPTASRWTTRASGAARRAARLRVHALGGDRRGRGAHAWTAWSRSWRATRRCRARTASWSSRSPGKAASSAWRSRSTSAALYDVGGVPPDPHRPDRGRRSARRALRLLRDLARRPSRASSPRKGLVTGAELDETHLPVRIRRARRSLLTRRGAAPDSDGGAAPPFRTSPHKETADARAKPALEAPVIGAEVGA